MPSLNLSKSDFKELHTALCGACDLGDLRLLVRYAFGLQLQDLVPADHTLRLAVLEVMEWAERNGLTIELVEEAPGKHPGNEPLARCYRKHLGGPLTGAESDDQREQAHRPQ